MIRSKYSIAIFLVLLTFAVYWRATNNQFVNMDDPGFVTENSHVLTGFTINNIRWAFSTTEMGNWNPVTWFSHMADCQLFDLNPRWHHLTSVAIHIANTVLLFFLLSRMTGSLWQSAFVAALFAIHPLHVESVAWVAERKDVLSTLFFMLTLVAYNWYLEHPVIARYMLVFGLFALGLMAKPMLVTLPFVLLLLDYWPLGRYAYGETAVAAGYKGGKQCGKSVITGIVLEKVPLIILSAIFSIVTIYAQKATGTLIPVNYEPISMRLSNALVAYVRYIGKMIWPANLAVIYPFPHQVPVWQVCCAVVVLTCMTVIAVRKMRKYPFKIVGWLWFIGTLLPVIGLVQVGSQAMADRYTYIPLIGLFIAIAWGAGEYADKRRSTRIVLSMLALVIIGAFASETWRQVGVWRNSIELFRHTIRVTRDNAIAHVNLGYALDEIGRSSEAMEHFSEAVRSNPNNYIAQGDLANMLSRSGNTAEAINHYRIALGINPADPLLQKNLGLCLLKQGNSTEAIVHFYNALKLRPDDADIQYNLGLAFDRIKNFEEAAIHYSAVLRSNPYDIEARKHFDQDISETRKRQGSAKR
jgi:tetratricopeptide (TPR) repeat protein